MDDRPDARDAPHRVVLYESDAALLEQLAEFVAAAEPGEAILVIATPAHRAALEAELRVRGFDLDTARAAGSYAALDAEQTLTKLMVGGRFDEARFREIVGAEIEAAAQRHARVRAFGEMVALLWQDGRSESALHLEDAWSRLQQRTPFALLCAYPTRAFESDSAQSSLLSVWNRHGWMLQRDGEPGAQSLDFAALERARLAAIVESSDDAIVSKTLDGTVTSWNAGAERLFGYTAREMLGRSISRLIPSDCTDDLAKILDTIRRGERVEHYETVRVRKDGRRVHVSLSVSPIKDALGNIVGASKIARDVTERLRYEEQLARQRAAIDALHRIGLTLSSELDGEKLLQAVSDAATRLTGARFGAFHSAPFAERIGNAEPLATYSGAARPAFEATPLFDPALASSGLLRVADVTQDPRFEPLTRAPSPPALPIRSYLAAPVSRRGHERFGVLALGHPEAGVFGEESEAILSGLAAYAAVAIDNARLYEAERRSRQEAERASRAKDEFLAMLGHELRNPLFAVRNAVTTALLDPTRRERALGIARRGVDQLARLVDDLLDVARITQGKVSLRKERLHLAGIVQRSIEMVRAHIEERAHRLTLSLPERSPVINGDNTRLEQVIVNLLMNAAKFTPAGGHIEVSLEPREDEAVLRVRDDGAGIAPEVLPHVFDLFTQEERGLDRSGGGLGVGLTVVRRIVELHQGRVEAHSDGIGRGATFIVRLPVITDAPEARGRAPRGAARSAHRARVLVVEDNPDAAEGVRMLLELLGHQVHVAYDGSAAIALAREQKPDVMLVDIGLPGVDGYEVARRVRAEPNLAKIALVALTGYGREEDRAQARAAGFDDHLTKPVEPDALTRIVAALAAAAVHHEEAAHEEPSAGAQSAP
ncbi:MAG TPA: PAS domain S-box protein [Myxococcota bacterium]|nr:PAS domain S-box protein [Myxococcota bacterium]